MSKAELVEDLEALEDIRLIDAALGSADPAVLEAPPSGDVDYGPGLGALLSWARSPRPALLLVSDVTVRRLCRAVRSSRPDEVDPGLHPLRPFLRGERELAFALREAWRRQPDLTPEGAGSEHEVTDHRLAGTDALRTDLTYLIDAVEDRDEMAMMVSRYYLHFNQKAIRERCGTDLDAPIWQWPQAPEADRVGPACGRDLALIRERLVPVTAWDVPV